MKETTMDLLIAVLSTIIAFFLLTKHEALWGAITAYWCLVSIRNMWKVGNDD